MTNLAYDYRLACYLAALHGSLPNANALLTVFLDSGKGWDGEPGIMCAGTRAAWTCAFENGAVGSWRMGAATSRSTEICTFFGGTDNMH
jgi:hypothetical protein